MLGKHLKSPGDTDEAPAHLGQTDGSLEEATARLKKLWNALRPLLDAGLKKQAAGDLLTAYAGPASQHALQLGLCSQQEAQNYDNVLKGAWETLLNRQLDDPATLLLGLPVKLGGTGVQWATTRRCAAYWAGWTAAAPEVQKDAGHQTLADLLNALPQTAAQLQQAREGLAAQGVPVQEGAALSNALGTHWKQRLYLTVAHKKAHAAHHQGLSVPGKATFHSAGGPGAGAFLKYPEDANCAMEDAHWETALRQRLGLKRAEHSQQTLLTARETCANRTAATGVTCGRPLDAQGKHSSTCKSGGGVLKKHGRLESAVCGLIKRWTLQTPLQEQRVPTWDREVDTADGGRRTETAILDIAYTDGAARRWIDVTIRHPLGGSSSEVSQAARRAGEAARRGERNKHARYPGEQLTAFAVETYGRVGAEARQWLKKLSSELPEEVQTAELNRAYKVISCAVQSELAEQLRAASGLK